MSKQMDFLNNCIDSAERGNEAAITLLRQICKEAADKAPTEDLLSMARHLRVFAIPLFELRSNP